VSLLDAAHDRRVDESRAQHQDAVEAYRLGYIFARDHRTYQRWLRRLKRQAGLVGAALETAVTSLAFTNPEYVVEGPR